MQSRAFIRSPQVYRIVKAPAATRSMSLFSAPSFIPRFSASPFASLDREVAPFLRMIDDLSRTFDHLSTVPSTTRAPATFQPRFDVREIEGAYELRGELPGVESNNIEVEFADAQTLVIRGRTESETTSGTQPQQVEAAQQEQQQQPAAIEATEPITSTTNAVADDAASTHSTSSYQKASVEDETAAAETAPSTPGQATPAESTGSEQQVAAPTQEQQVQAQATANTPRYWVSERRTGSFQRVFSFPTKIDQEAVRASLKNGVLSVVVPKAVAQAPRRIAVQ